MAMIPLRAVRLFSLFVVLFSINLVYTQSKNTDAMKWYALADKEQDNSKKIAAYLKAVEYDPKLVEAYLGLGVAYKSTADYKNAEKYLVKAYAAKLAEIGGALKSNILFELAGVYRLLGKNEAAKDALQGAKNLSQDQDLLSRISLDLGGIFFQQNRFKEAFEELTKGLLRTQEPDNYYNKLLHAAKKMVELEKEYNAALQAGYNGNYKRAKNLFDKIQQNSPGFKDVEQQIIEMNKRIGPEIDLAEAGKVEENIVENTNGQAIKKAQEQQNYRKQDIQPEPIGRVKNIRSIPNASNRIETIDELAEQLARSDDSNNGLLNLDTALNKVKNPDIIQGWAVQNARQGAKGDYSANGQAQDQSARDSNDQSLLAGLALSVIMIPIITLLAFSPTARARFYILFRQYDRASEIYERILARHPEKLWVYPALAKTYDICGYKDPRAIRVYKMLQHLNGQPNNGSNFNTAIAEKYLHDPGNNTHTVEILDET